MITNLVYLALFGIMVFSGMPAERMTNVILMIIVLRLVSIEQSINKDKRP